MLTAISMLARAMFLAHQAVSTGAAECAMALGFEKMQAGSLKNHFDDRTNPLDKTMQTIHDTVGISSGPFAAQIFGNGGDEYCKKYGATWEDIGRIAVKNHEHSTRNPYSQFQNAVTLEEVMKDKKVASGVSEEGTKCNTMTAALSRSGGWMATDVSIRICQLTRAMCCPTSDGGACAIIASEEFVHKHKLENQAIEM